MKKIMSLFISLAWIAMQLSQPLAVFAQASDIEKISIFDSAADMLQPGDEYDPSIYNAIIFGNHSANAADIEGGLAVSGTSFIPRHGAFNYGAYFDNDGAGAGIPLEEAQRIALLVGQAVKNYSEALAVVGNGYLLTADNQLDWIAQDNLLVNGAIKVTSPATIATIFTELQAQIKGIEDATAQVIASEQTEFGSHTLTSLSGEFQVYESETYPGRLVVEIPADENGLAFIPQASGLTAVLGTEVAKKIVITTQAKHVVFADTLLVDGRPVDVWSDDFQTAAQHTLYYFPQATQVTNFYHEQSWDTLLAPNISLSATGAEINQQQPLTATGDDQYDQAYFQKYKSARTAVAGSVIAPQATIILDSGNLNGFVTSQNLHQRNGAELHNFGFDLPGFTLPTSTSVTLTKVDADSQAVLAGAEFELQTQAGEVIRTQLLTDEYGKLYLEDLPIGLYQLVEVKAPEGYELDATPVLFEITGIDDQVIELVKENQVSLASKPGGEVPEIGVQIPPAVPGGEVPEIGVEVPPAVPGGELPEIGVEVPPAVPGGELPEIGVETPSVPGGELPEIGVETPAIPEGELPEIGVEVPPAVPGGELPEIGVETPSVPGGELPEIGVETPSVPGGELPEIGVETPSVPGGELPEIGVETPAVPGGELPEIGVETPAVPGGELPEIGVETPSVPGGELPEIGVETPSVPGGELPEIGVDLLEQADDYYRVSNLPTFGKIKSVSAEEILPKTGAYESEVTVAGILVCLGGLALLLI